MGISRHFFVVVFMLGIITSIKHAEAQETGKIILLFLVPNLTLSLIIAILIRSKTTT